MKRRQAMISLAAVAVAPAVAPASNAAVVNGYPAATQLDSNFLPHPEIAGESYKFLKDESTRRTAAAAFDRLIPADEFGPSASQAGCIEFLDAQLAGAFGQGLSLYRESPEPSGADKMMQTPQFIATPQERYLSGLAALETYSKQKYEASFADLQPAQQDEILAGMEAGSIVLSNDVNTKAFFELLLQNVREGYFADPLYGGNKDMAGWKMIGFPGARYDYRKYADKTGQKLGLQPVSLIPPG